MHMSRRGAWFAAVCSVALLAGAAPPAAAETLAEAIALAYETNPTLQSQRASLRALDEGVFQARAGWRPTLSITALANYTETRAPGTGRPAVDLNGDGRPDTAAINSIEESNFGRATLNLNQPIWTGGRVAAAVSAAQADILSGRESLRRVEAQVLSSVISAYVDVRRDQQALAIRRTNVEVLTQQLEESRARFEVGEITRTDVAQAEARLAASQAQLQQANAQLEISRAAYAAVVGRNPGELAPEPSLQALLPASVDQAFEVAEANNPQIRAAEYAAQASKARVAGAKSEHMPSVSIAGSLGYSGPARPFESSEYDRAVVGQAIVSVPLFAGGLTTSRVRAQVERNNADRLGVEAARRTVQQAVTQSWNLLTAARANIGSTAEQVRAARIAAEGTRQEKQVGLRTTIEVLNAEQELRSAELAQVSAARDEYVAASQVLAAMGRLEARSLVPAATRYDPESNARKLRFTWGWVPWEEPVGALDSAFGPKVRTLPREEAPTLATEASQGTPPSP